MFKDVFKVGLFLVIAVALLGFTMSCDNLFGSDDDDDDDDVAVLGDSFEMTVDTGDIPGDVSKLSLASNVAMEHNDGPEDDWTRIVQWVADAEDKEDLVTFTVTAATEFKGNTVDDVFDEDAGGPGEDFEWDTFEITNSDVKIVELEYVFFLDDGEESVSAGKDFSEGLLDDDLEDTYGELIFGDPDHEGGDAFFVYSQGIASVRALGGWTEDGDDAFLSVEIDLKPGWTPVIQYSDEDTMYVESIDSVPENLKIDVN